MDDLAAEFPERFGVFVDVTEQRPFKQATEPVLEGPERGRDQRDARLLDPVGYPYCTTLHRCSFRATFRIVPAAGDVVGGLALPRFV
jgi:hypothetical protein